jgi:hypothetical protein
MRLTDNSLIWLCAGRTPNEKPFLKLTATVERNGEIFALTSRWHSDIRNVIKIGVIRPADEMGAQSA